MVVFINAQIIQIAVHVDNFGAKGDGNTDDSFAIQQAIDYANANKIGNVYFSNKTYIVSKKIKLRSNINLVGGNGTVLKVSDTCTGFYGLLALEYVENVSIRNLIIDGNRERPAKYNIDYKNGGRPEILVYLVSAKNIHIENNTFNSCGIWTISCETGLEDPYNDFVYIRNNKINYDMGRNTKTPNPITGETVDTTQMYIDAKNYWIENNVIKTANTIARTAIETHRMDGVASNNIIEGFMNGVLIVPSVNLVESSDVSRISVMENKMNDVCNGIILWPVPQRSLENVFISDNSIELNPGRFSGASSSKGISNLSTLPAQNNAIIDVKITENTIKFKEFITPFSDPGNVVNFCGISLYSWVSLENIKVSDNMIIDAPCTGVLVGSRSNSAYINYTKNILVEDNLIINAGKNENIATQSYNPRSSIRVNGSNTEYVKDTVVRNNTIVDNHDSITYFTKPTYFVAYDPSSCDFHNNRILANGFTVKDRVTNFDINLNWDNQVGTPVFIKDASYILKENYVKFFGSIEIKGMGTFTQGFGSSIVLPFHSNETRDVPIIVTNTIGDTVSQWYIKLTKGSKIGLISCLKHNNTVSTLTYSTVKVGTRLSFGYDYLVQ
ncbi:glycoside hydrolase family 55 protein [Peribacillus frigoritolerans]|uniref:glycoside hydrolase family 55 protein n=1 Tax=Peribacillus frigoritolerans TaxID=450367 RepID=UPI001EFE4562|nr:glycoside hydrolase family 55 protein [Peribacillus frigoritolerans]ULM95669.1 glycoside hydrolase family 55 protein [Peribacillus frigoritolerans]